MRTRLFAAALVIVAGCGGGGGGGVTPPPPAQKLGSITVTPATLNLAAGTTGTVGVQALDESGQPIANATGFTFTIQNTNIAEVSGAGSVLALSAGATQMVVALTRDGVTKQATVNIAVTGSLPTNASVTATTGNEFSPRQVAIARTGIVNFTFQAVVHNVVFGSASGAPSNIDNTSNTSVSRTFNTAGNFAYQCTLHGGMTGTVIVR